MDASPRPVAGLDTDVVRAHLATRAIGLELDYHRCVGSTNDLALQAGGPHGRVVVAEEQRAGRGRGGSEWLTPAGRALTFSVILAASRPELLFQTTMAASVGVCLTLHALGVADAHIKWPNDVLVGRRKIAGILCESRSRGGVLGPIVAGIGINVNQTPEELPELATSVRVVLGESIDRAVFLARVLNELEAALDLRDAGEGRLHARWEGLSRLHAGHRVHVDHAGRQVEAISDGLDPDGALGVRLDDGERIRVLAGGVSFL